MSLACVYSRARVGLVSPLVTVEVHLSNGLPAFHIVGLPEASVKESKDRVRVTPNPIYLVNPNNTYKLSMGSTVRSLSNHSVNGENSVLRVPLSASHTYLTTQAYDNLTWSVNLTDSTGHGLEGEMVHFNYYLQSTGYVTVEVETDSNGYASGVENLGVCLSNQTSLEHYSYNNSVKTWWTTDFAAGDWNLRVPNAFEDDYEDLGVSDVVLGHLCNHNFIRSEY